MNIIGLMGPKIVTLLIILIPSYELKYKLILVALWGLKLIIDYDAARPSHGGNIYKLTKHVEFEVGELMVTLIKSIPSFVYLGITVFMKLWIPLIPGMVAAIISIASIIWCIKDVIVERKKRRERNANSDSQK